MPKDIAKQHRKMFLLWAAVLISQILFVVLIYVSRPALFRFEFTESIWGNSMAQMIGFAVVGVAVVMFSFSFRQRFRERAVESRDRSLLQSGLIIAVALCEACTLIGVALAFAFEYQYFFFWPLLGIIGTLLHFPQLAPLTDAAFNKNAK